MFGKNNFKDLTLENARLQVKLELALEQNIYLKNKVDELHKALLAKISPIAYGDILAKESDAERVKSDNLSEAQKEEIKFLRDYAVEIEKPLFKDVDDLMLRMGNIIGFNPPSATHNNEES